MTSQPQTDLSAETFFALRNRFFDEEAHPRPFPLREKGRTQDDPLDEYICRCLEHDLPKDLEVEKASGSLISPDLVVYRPKACAGASRASLLQDSTRILGLEVKKLERQSGGGISRSSGLDYNTTPPCGTIRVYSPDGQSLDISGYYLFVCQEAAEGEPGNNRLTAMVLCDGDLLNEDFDYYQSIVGTRSKEIGLGTYGDGANRVRPMLIFSNPLGAPFLDQNSTLVHRRGDLESDYPTLRRIGAIERTVVPTSSGDKGEIRLFYCYRDRRDVSVATGPFHERDPFPIPQRSKRTTPRGRFVIHISPLS